MKKVKKKKIVLGTLLFLFLSFSTLTIMAFQKDSVLMVNTAVGSYTQKGVFHHEGIFSNNSLYKTPQSMEYYPRDITKNISGVYRYSFSPRENVNGNYTLEIITIYYVSKGNEKIVLWDESILKKEGILKNGTASEAVFLNLQVINARSAEIKQTLKIPRLSREVRLVFHTKPSGIIANENILEDFTQSIGLVEDTATGLIYFTNEEKVTRKNIIESKEQRNFLTFLGKSVEVRTGKILFSVLMLFTGIPLFGMVYTAKGKAPKDELKDLRQYIIEGIPNRVDKKITLATKYDLRKAFELLDKPIMHYKTGSSEVYTIVDEGVSYEYKELKKDN